MTDGAHIVENTDGMFVASFATKLLADFFVEEGTGCYRHRQSFASPAAEREEVARLVDPSAWGDLGHDSYLQRADEWYAKGRTTPGDPLTDGYRKKAAEMVKPSLEAADAILALLAKRPTAEEGDGQDRKFAFRDGQYVNRISGEAIPLDEPVIIFRARDHHALPLLREYLSMATDPKHQRAIKDRMAEFGAYAREHPERMKEPGITGDIRLNDERPTAEGELREAFQAFFDHVEADECKHEYTYRGGAIWTICRDCDRKWADDDRGGFPGYVEPAHIAAARAALGGRL